MQRIFQSVSPISEKANDMYGYVCFDCYERATKEVHYEQGDIILKERYCDACAESALKNQTES